MSADCGNLPAATNQGLEMAKSAKGRAASKAPKQKPNTQPNTPISLAARVILEVGADVPSYYVNYVDIAQSAHEFTLSVAKVPTRLAAQAMQNLQATGELRAEALLQLIVPPTLLPSLIKALVLQKDLYEQINGPIHDASEAHPAPVTKGTLQ
jgi:hypothetical protein